MVFNSPECGRVRIADGGGCDAAQCLKGSSWPATSRSFANASAVLRGALMFSHFRNDTQTDVCVLSNAFGERAVVALVQAKGREEARESFGRCAGVSVAMARGDRPPLLHPPGASG